MFNLIYISALLFHVWANAKLSLVEAILHQSVQRNQKCCHTGGCGNIRTEVAPSQLSLPCYGKLSARTQTKKDKYILQCSTQIKLSLDLAGSEPMILFNLAEEAKSIQALTSKWFGLLTGQHISIDHL